MSSEEDKTKIGATHRPYDEAFKRAAVAQWQSGAPVRRVARGPGHHDREPAHVAAAVCWDTSRVGRRGGRQAAAVTPTAQELQAEVRRLRAQLQSVTNQRDILKKAVGIFAGPNGSVLP